MICNVGMYGALGGAAAAAVLGFVARRRATGLVPMLAAPPEDAVVTPADRLRYFAAHGTALALGLAAVLGLYLLAPPLAEAHTYRVTDGVGWLLGPFFVVLAVGATCSPALVRWFVPASALQALLWRASRRAGHMDLRPLSVRLGAVVLLLALALHFGLAGVFLRLDEGGVRWRSQPFGAERARGWSAVRDVQLVRTFEAMTGRVVERPYLRLQFVDGVVAEHGRFDVRPPTVWEEAAAYASARAGVPVRSVDI